jgi:hypothetical protein
MCSLTLCMTTSKVAMMMSCERLALPNTAPNEMRTAAAQKSDTNKLLIELSNELLSIFT